MPLNRNFEDHPLVSVIIPTRNSERTLAKCLKSIRNQTYHKLEIIVVDNHSTDRTKEIAKKYAHKVINQGGGMGVQVNKGVSESQGEFIAYFDADMYLTSNVIEECVKKAREGYHALIVPERVISNSFWSRVRDVEKRFYAGDLDVEAARFYLKSVYLSVGGINEKLKGYRDFDVHQKVKRAGYAVGRVNSYILHDVDPKLLLILKKRFVRAETIFEYLKEHPMHTKSFIFRKKLILGTIKLFFKDPILASGIIILKTGEYLASFLGLIWYKFKKFNI
jgi:glycosyltransferase involved in cell wall biosynthesis